MPRKEKKYHFIYKTVNMLTLRYYIGMHSTDNLEDGYLGSGKRLRYSIRKYGVENHKREILEYCDSREELANREEQIVSLNEIAKEECMNLVIGGKGFYPNSKEQILASKKGIEVFRKKMIEDSEFRKKYQKMGSDNLKKAHQEGKIKYDTFTGKNHSDNSKIKMSNSMKGKNKGSSNGSYNTCWITNDIDNKKINKNDLIPEGYRLGRKIN